MLYYSRHSWWRIREVHLLPEIEGDNVIASIELPAGATAERTEAVVRRLEEAAVNIVFLNLIPLVENGDPAIKSLKCSCGGAGQRPA